MASEAVRRVQELRRSNAAQPIPGKRREDALWQDDIPHPCGLCGEECVPCSEGESRIDECTCLCA